jgi:hypothetical protein
MLQTLKRANASLAMGDSLGAAGAYEELLQQSARQVNPQYAFFCIQAGYARLFSGELAQAMAHFRRGLEVFSAHQRYAQMYHVAQRIKVDLERRGCLRESRLMAAFVTSNMPASADMPTQHLSQEAQNLPADCPVCGGTLRSFELHWLDARTVECGLCVSPLVVL